VHGNPQALGELRRWAEAWKSGKPRERTAILAGPPGSGKTSAAHALAAEMGWELIELNASDARSAPAIQRVAGVGSVHQTFSDSGAYLRADAGQRKLIVLDEADHLYERGGDSADESGRDLGDRGGKRAIADTVAQTRQPIILIVNDLYELTKGAGDRIARAAVKITFRRLPAPSVRKILRDVAAQEGVHVAEAVLEALAARSEGDLRSALNDLEALAAGRSEVESLGEMGLGERQRAQGAFDVVATILKSTDARRAIDAARGLDETPDFLLAWLDENVPTEYRNPHDLARAYDALSRADVFLGRTMRRQQFGLWGYATELLAGGVAAAKSQRYATPPMYRFPGWIRRMGATKGSRGVRDRLAEKLGAVLHMGSKAVQRDVLLHLRQGCLRSPRLADAVALRAELDEDEVRYLLGPHAPARFADQVVEHVEQRRTAVAQTQAELEAHPEPESPKPKSRSRGTSLGDF
jgi:replication factor C large subunit